MIQVVLITRTGKAYLANGIAAFTLDKEAYTPYSQLTATVYGNFSIQQFAGIYRVQLLLDGTELHFGTVERFRLVQENGTSYVRFSSHGLTALLLQNQLEPGLHTAMSLDKLMQDFVTFPKEITWESDTDTSNYLFVKEGTSMWDGVANLTYKLCGRYPFVYHANEIRMHLPETYRNFYVGADTLLGMGMTADQSRIYSRVFHGRCRRHLWKISGERPQRRSTGTGADKTAAAGSAVSLRPAAGSGVSAEICRTGIGFLLFRPHRSSGSRSGRPDHLLRHY